MFDFSLMVSLVLPRPSHIAGEMVRQLADLAATEGGAVTIDPRPGQVVTVIRFSRMERDPAVIWEINKRIRELSRLALEPATVYKFFDGTQREELLRPEPPAINPPTEAPAAETSLLYRYLFGNLTSTSSPVTGQQAAA